jgi:hypothetical protein
MAMFARQITSPAHIDLKNIDSFVPQTAKHMFSYFRFKGVF